MSFVKKGAVKPTELGTRPGLSGQTLVSTGLADFDKLLGGGLPLGTVTLLLEDSYTQHHLTLLKYFLAEGAANSQALQWIVGQGRHSSAAKMLPQQVNYVPKEDVKEKQKASEEVQLRIAWQYRRYIKSKQKAAADTRSAVSNKTNQKAKTGTAALGSVRDWCHNYDLARTRPFQELSISRAESPCFSGAQATQSFTAAVATFVSSLAQPSDNSSANPRQHQTPKPSKGPDPSLKLPAKPLQSLAPLSINNDYAETSGQHLPGVSASQTIEQHVQPATHARGQGYALPARLQPSGAVQSNSNLTHSNIEAAAAQPHPAATSTSEMFKAGERSPVGTAEKAQSVGRVGVESLGGLAWQLQGSDAEVEKQIYVAVFQLKVMIRDSRCAAMVSFPAGLYSSSLTARLAHLCDSVIGLEAVRDDSDIVRLIPEPASCCGLLHLQKLPSLNALGPPIPDTTLFIIRHKRRRLTIQAVQIDPDAEAGDADTKSAAAALCGGPPQAEKPFDF